MISTFGDLIVCLCGGELAPVSSDDAVACQTCQRKYEYKDGILATCDADADRDVDARVLEEQRTRDKQARLYDTIVGVNVPSWSEGRLIRKHLKGLASRASLDVGCGTGRQTTHLAVVSQRVIAADRSMMSLRLCRQKLKERNMANRVLLVQADVQALPVRKGVVDLVVTAQVLQHLPGEAARDKAVGQIADALGEGGLLIASLYEWSGKPWRRHKEAFHAGGISAFRFTKAEVEALFGSRFEFESLESCLGDLIVSKARKRRG